MAEKGRDGWKTLGVKLKKGSPFISQIAVRRPAVKDLPEEQAERTLYLAGLPLGVDDEIVQNICTCFGGVDQVALHQSKVSRHCCCYHCISQCDIVAYPDSSAVAADGMHHPVMLQHMHMHVDMHMHMHMPVCARKPDVCRFMQLAVVVLMPAVCATNAGDRDSRV